MEHPHAKFIDALGGNLEVSRLLDGVSNKTAHMWRKRGIPYRYRRAFAQAAGERKVKLPRDFVPAWMA